jgi:molybdate transport system substrate-binding protein
VDRGAAALSDEAVEHVAIANPEHAPYGRAAQAALRSLGLYDALGNKLVLGANVAQTASLVQSGGADIGIIALSLAKAPAMRGGDAFELPLSRYPALRQGGVIIPGHAGESCARSLAEFMQTEQAKRVLASWGFLPPAAGG